MRSLFAWACLHAMVAAVRRQQDGTDMEEQARMNASIDSHSGLEAESVTELGAGVVLRERYVLEERIRQGRQPGKAFPQALKRLFTGTPRHLGTGSFGDTWKAYDSSLKKFVAVKIFFDGENNQYLSWKSATPEQQANLKDNAKECTLLQKMKNYSDVYVGSSRICQCYQEHVMDAVKTDRPVFLVLEMCGRELADVLEEKSRLGKTNISEAANWMKQLVEGVAFMQMFHPPLIHHDLKPGNIAVDGDNLKIIDWGTAIQATPEQESEWASYTPAYAAPEVNENQGMVSFVSPPHSYDVYALGLIYIELLCPRVNYAMWSDLDTDEHITFTAIEIKQLLTNCPNFGTSSSALQHINVIAKMLSRSPEDRPTPMELLTTAPLVNASWASLASAASAKLLKGQAVTLYNPADQKEVNGTIATARLARDNKHTVYDVKTAKGVIKDIQADYLMKQGKKATLLSFARSK